MKNIWTIMSKEFTRFFTDRRMVVMTLMPAILIYVVYSFMGTAMQSIFVPDEDYTPGVYVVNLPESLNSVVTGGGFNVIRAQEDEADEIKGRIRNKEKGAEALVIFPKGFDSLVDAYDAQTADTAAPNIELYCNSTEPNSAGAYSVLIALFAAYESSLANKFDINRDIDSDLATAEEQSATFISMMMPMLLMIFLISGCTGLALESITGEKERGTLATLLVSPLGRSELAIGKILSLAVLAFISGMATTIATVLSLPNLMGGAGDVLETNIYGITDYVLLSLVILSVLLLMVAMLSIVSAFSKTVKEAGQATTPVMILVMVVGVTGMFGSTATDKVMYMIPLYGSVQSMSGIFSLEYNVTNIVIACASSLVYACIGGFILTKMFNSEKIMFSR